VKITNVTFRSSVQLQPFQHVHVEMSASVGDGEDPTVVLDLVKGLVAAQLQRALNFDPTAPRGVTPNVFRQPTRDFTPGGVPFPGEEP
jgi:hypothetical protein